jgi:hypothetical protein
MNPVCLKDLVAAYCDATGSEEYDSVLDALLLQ